MAGMVMVFIPALVWRDIAEYLHREADTATSQEGKLASQ